MGFSAVGRRSERTIKPTYRARNPDLGPRRSFTVQLPKEPKEPKSLAKEPKEPKSLAKEPKEPKSRAKLRVKELPDPNAIEPVKTTESVDKFYYEKNW
jgi:hypothetical protein